MLLSAGVDMPIHETPTVASVAFTTACAAIVLALPGVVGCLW